MSDRHYLRPRESELNTNLASSSDNRQAILQRCRRIVIKVGTNTLMEQNALHRPTMREIARQISRLHNEGRQLVLVTSGAVGLGAAALGLAPPIQNIRLRQAAAAVGQPLLMHSYRQYFQRHRQLVAQVLITRGDFNDRLPYLNLRNTLETLLSRGVVPICNENDSVAIDELGSNKGVSKSFGDNDNLCALIADKLDADLLIILTDIDALYSTHPQGEGAYPLAVVNKIDGELVKRISSTSQTFSRGGMQAKLKAIRVAVRAGCHTLIAHGRAPRVLLRLLKAQEEKLGTFFYAEPPVRQSKRWMLVGAPQGHITIDRGALQALHNGKSLLPRGVVAIAGHFSEQALIEVHLEKSVLCARLITSLSSEQLRAIIGKRSDEARTILPEVKPLIARPERIILIEKREEYESASISI